MSLLLTSAILGIHSIDGERYAAMIPEGATVKLVSETLGDNRMVDVLWEGHSLAVFAEDLNKRGAKMKSLSA